LFSEFELVEEVNLSKSNNNIMTKLEKQYDDIKTMLSNLLPTKQKFASLDVGEGKLIYTSGEFTKDAMVFFDEAMTMPAEGTFTVEGKTIVIEAGAVRTTPILLTAGTVVIGAFIILFDPIFQGLAIALMGGSITATFLTLILVPLAYYMTEKHKH